MVGFLRLTGLLALLGLFTSRLTLILHEVLGHALPALAVGSHRLEIELFWFAGGYVRFSRPEPYELDERLVISLGGIGLQLVLAAIALWLAHRWRDRPRLSLVALGYATIVAVHGWVYLATGAWHGYGDGWLLHRELGDLRWVVALPAAAAAVATTYWLARRVAARLRGMLPARGTARQLGWLFGAIALAGGIHAALSFGEIHLRRDRSYAQVMEHQSKRDAARELARYVEAERRRGVALEREQIARVRAELEEKHRPFPLDRVLVLLVALAAIAGAARARPKPEALPTLRELAPLGVAVAALVTGIVLVSLI